MGQLEQSLEQVGRQIRFSGGQSMDIGNDPMLALNRFTLFIVGKNSLPEGFSMILGPDDLQDNSQVRWESGSAATFLGLVGVRSATHRAKTLPKSKVPGISPCAR